MDLRSLQTFIQVAESNSFTRAGEKLGYSQPTVSLQIKQLEQELGVQLFDRIGHTVSLTEGGRDALAYAQRICHMSDEMLQGTARQTEPDGIIRLAMADSLCTPLILDEFVSFHERYPKISLHVTAAGTDEMSRLLDHNEVDIVCTLDSHIYNTTYVISNEEKIGVHFICSAESPLVHKKEIMIQDLLEYPFLLTEKGMSYRRVLDESLARENMEIRPILEIGRSDLICKLVSKNMGLSFLPDYVTEEAVQEGKIVRLKVKDFKVEVWKQILHHRDKWVSAQMQVLLKHLEQIILGGRN